MQYRRRALLAALGAGVLFVLVQLGALALVEPFRDAGFQAVEDPEDPTNSLLYVGFLLVVTAGMLLVIRLDADWLLRAVLVGTAALLSWYVFAVLVGPLADALGVDGNWVALALAAAFGVALWAYPEWYVIDAAGVLMGAGAAGLFGISFGVLPAIVLLGALAVYDALAVYRTKHMLTLAEGVMDLRVPVLLVFPLRADYSFRRGPPRGAGDEESSGGADDGDEGRAEADAAVPGDDTDAEAAGAGDDTDAEAAGAADDERDAFFIGLGDAVMPTIMVASAAAFLDVEPLVAGTALTLPAAGAMVGTLVGLAVLLHWVFRGRAHAGLPLLNGGAIGGYLVGALAAGVPLAEALGLASHL